MSVLYSRSVIFLQLMNFCVVVLSLFSSDILTWSANTVVIFSATIHKLRGVGVEEYPYYVKKLRQNVGLET